MSGIDPDGDGGLFLQAAGHPVDQAQLLRRLHIEQQDLFLQGEFDLGLGLPDPGINDLFRRNAGLEGPVQLAPGDDIGPASQTPQQAQQRQIGVGLQGKTGQMGNGGEGFVKGLEMMGQRGRTVQIEGGAHGLGDPGYRRVFGVKGPLPVMKMVHGLSSSGVILNFNFLASGDLPRHEEPIPRR